VAAKAKKELLELKRRLQPNQQLLPIQRLKNSINSRTSSQLVLNLSSANVLPRRFGKNTKTNLIVPEFHSRFAASLVSKILTQESVPTLDLTTLTSASTSSSIRLSKNTTDTELRTSMSQT